MNNDLENYIRFLKWKNEETIDKSRYPFSPAAVKDIEKIQFHGQVTFFVGENGSGKSTVLEAIAALLGFNEEGGNFSMKFSTVNSISQLKDNLRLVKGIRKPKDGFFLRAESFFNVATYLDEMGPLKDFGYKQVHSRSHGEAFLDLMNHKFKGQGIYITDEPEAALSPTRQLAALCRIHDLVKQNSQFIIVTHSTILLAYPDARIYNFDAQGIHETIYEETDPFFTMKDFLNNYPKRIHQLLDS